MNEVGPAFNLDKREHRLALLRLYAGSCSKYMYDDESFDYRHDAIVTRGFKPEIRVRFKPIIRAPHAGICITKGKITIGPTIDLYNPEGPSIIENVLQKLIKPEQKVKRVNISPLIDTDIHSKEFESNGNLIVVEFH